MYIQYTYTVRRAYDVLLFFSIFIFCTFARADLENKNNDIFGKTINLKKYI